MGVLINGYNAFYEVKQSHEGKITPLHMKTCLYEGANRDPLLEFVYVGLLTWCLGGQRLSLSLSLAVAHVRVCVSPSPSPPR